jgi:DNA-binding GntR family transcriptional regulator
VTDRAAEALHAPSLVEMTTRRLRAEILSGELAPGQRLVEEQICRRLAISRAPLREALRLLANEGLVDHLPRRGARVTELSDRDVDELFGLRAVLERYAVQRAFPLTGPPGTDRLAEVRAHLEQMKRAGDDGDELGKDDAHRAFHAAIVALAGDHQLDLAIEPILVQLQRPMAANLRREAALLGPRVGLERHERLLAALETNDLDVVLAALGQHGSRRFLPTSPEGGRRRQRHAV